MVGGAFLCFEGFEKIAHRFMHGGQEEAAHRAELAEALLTNPAVDLVAFEKDKIRGAVRTDFVLSAEIIAITLGTVASAPFATQVAVLTGIALIMTVGVYGIVAGIVKLDDAGLYLSRKSGESPGVRMQRAIGEWVLRAAPYLMKGLSIAGTAAMFLVGGGILTHGIPAAHHLIEAIAHRAGSVPGVGAALEFVTPALLDAIAGIVAGALVLLGVTAGAKILRSLRGKDAAAQGH